MFDSVCLIGIAILRTDKVKFRFYFLKYNTNETQLQNVYSLFVKMLSEKIVFISFLYLVKPIKLTSDNVGLIEKHVNVKYLPHSFLQAVEIKSNKFSLIRNICTYHPESESRTPTIGKAHGLSILANCKFALWTIYELKKLIPPFHVFYPPKFGLKTSYSEFEAVEIYRNLKVFLDFVARGVTKMSELMYTVLYDSSEFTENIYDNYTFTLKRLFTLLIKSKYIYMSTMDVTDHAYIPSQHIQSYTELLRLTVSEIIELQRILLMDCDEIPEEDKSLGITTGIWVPLDERNYVSYSYSQTSLPNVINKVLHLRKPNQKCDVYNLLNIILNIDMSKIPFDEIADALVVFSNSKSIAIRDMIKQFPLNYDLNVLYWIHETIYIAIMKQIFTKISYLLDKRNGKNISIPKIRYGIEETSAIPTHVWRGLSLLRKIKKNSSKTHMIQKLRADVDEYLFSFGSVELELSLKEVRLSPYQNVYYKNSPEQNTSEINAKYNTIISELSIVVMSNIKNFECYEYFFRPVKDNYHKTLARKTPSLFLKTYTEKLTNNCDFVKYMFSLCFRASTFLNWYVNEAHETQSRYLNDLKTIILNIKDIFLFVVKKYTDDDDILVMAYNVSAILVNCKLEHKNEYFHFTTERILNVITNEINRYEIKNCSNPKLPFYINIVSDNIRSTEIIKAIKNFFMNNIKNINSDDLNFETNIMDEDWHFFSVDHTYRSFLENSIVDTSYYEKRIKIIWNGLPQSLKTIINNESVIIFDPRIILLLYKVCFKFTVAVIFFRIQEVLSNFYFNHMVVQSHFDVIKEKLIKYGYERSELFPVALNDILTDIDKIKFSYEQQLLNFNLKTLKNQIKKKLKNFNIVFENTQEQLMPVDEFKNAFDELLCSVRIIFKFYIKITRGNYIAS